MRSNPGGVRRGTRREGRCDGEDCEPRFGIQGDVVGDGEDCEVDCDEAPISTGGSGDDGEADSVTVA
jgi:hypothetical protein